MGGSLTFPSQASGSAAARSPRGPVHPARTGGSSASRRGSDGGRMNVYKISNGWFSEVCGRSVLKRDMDEPGYDAFPYDRGYPIGIMEHFTAGCGTDLSGVIRDRGYV